MVLFEISKDEQLRESLIWIETQGMLGEQIIVPVYRGEYARFESPYKVTIISGEPFIQDNMVTFPRVFLVPDHQGLPQGFFEFNSCPLESPSPEIHSASIRSKGDLIHVNYNPDKINIYRHKLYTEEESIQKLKEFIAMNSFNF